MNVEPPGGLRHRSSADHRQIIDLDVHRTATRPGVVPGLGVQAPFPAFLTLKIAPNLAEENQFQSLFGLQNWICSYRRTFQGLWCLHNATRFSDADIHFRPDHATSIKLNFPVCFIWYQNYVLAIHGSLTLFLIYSRLAGGNVRVDFVFICLSPVKWNWLLRYNVSMKYSSCDQMMIISLKL